MNTLPDIQKTKDVRNVAIQQVGVTGIKLPVRLLVKPPSPPWDQSNPASCDVVGEFEISCSLPYDVKGTHMSRFTEVLGETLGQDRFFSHDHFIPMVRELHTRLEAVVVKVSMVADYFIEQMAPVTARKSLAPLRVGLSVISDLATGNMKHTTQVILDGKTCCPCSREISDFDHKTGRGKGAHAQRSTVDLSVITFSPETIWFEDLAATIWLSYSSPVYPVLKRLDEREVTMNAYNNPKFVEDVIRDVIVNTRRLRRIYLSTRSEEERETPYHQASWDVKVRVQNAESIHYHDAFAETLESM